MPELAAYELAKSWFAFWVWLVIFSISFIVTLLAIYNSSDPSPVVFICVMAMFISFGIGISHAYDIVKINANPKMYLEELDKRYKR